MKKKSIKLIFSFLTLCVCTEIQGQESSKKRKERFNGEVSLNYDFTNNFTGNINLNYNRENWDLYLDYSGHSDRIEVSSELTRYIQNNKTLRFIETEQHHLSHLINLQLHLRPSPHNLFFWEFKIHLPEITTNQDIGNYEHNRIAFTRKTLESSLAYKHVFEQDRNELTVNGIFSYTKDSRPSKYRVDDVIAHVSDSKESPQFARLELDYTKTLPNEGTLKAGLGFFSRWNKMDYTFNTTQDRTPFRSILKHNEYILSPFLSYSAQEGQLYYKIGLQADYDINRRNNPFIDQKRNTDLFYLYLSLSVKYNFSDHQEIDFRFTRNATRPDYPQLTPSVTYIDHQTFEQGNPMLKPEITNRVEINHSYSGKQAQVNSTLYFSTTEKFISPVYSISSDDKLLLSYTNGSILNKVGLDVGIPMELTPRLALNPVFSLLHTHTTGTHEGISLRSDAFCLTNDWELTFTPLKYTEIQAYFSYRSPTKVPQFKIKEDYYLDLSLRQGFLKDRLQISFSVTDVFDTSEWDARSLKGQHDLANYSKEATHAYWVGLTFRFNSYTPRETPDDLHPAKRSPIRLGQ